jgi:hypothetical protein
MGQIQVGTSTSKFQVQPQPAGSVFPAGTTFALSSNDPALSFAADPGDPTGSTFIATDAASDTSASANIAGAAQLPAVNGVTPAPLATPVLVETIAPAAAPVATGAVVVQTV